MTLHGTLDGYQDHLDADETPCQPCARANTASNRGPYQPARGRGVNWPLALPLSHLDDTAGFTGLAIAHAIRESA